MLKLYRRSWGEGADSSFPRNSNRQEFKCMKYKETKGEEREARKAQSDKQGGHGGEKV